MENRPKLKLNLSPFDKNIEVASKIFLVLMWALAIYTSLKLPKIIPTHYNDLGQVDNYTNKLTLLILPILATLIYLGLTQLNKYPHNFNYMTKITEDNALNQYTIATRMLRFMKLAILLTFSWIILFTYLTTIRVANGLGFWFLPITIGILIIPNVISINKSFKKKNNVAE